MSFNPLQKVQDAKDSGRISQKIYNLICNRFHIIEEGINRIERASGLNYPYYYVEPNLVISTSELEYTQFGILFARTIPVVGEDSMLRVVVQVTAPLVAFGLLGTIHAVLAHEFMHYLELVNRVTRINIISDEISGTLFEGTYADSARLLDKKVVFKSDRTLVDHITKKFPEGFRDVKLEDKVIKQWMDKGLPTSRVPIDSNIIKIPMEVMAKLDVEQSIKDKISEYENSMTRKKKSTNYV